MLLPVEVRVRTTLPEASSAAVGVYPGASPLPVKVPAPPLQVPPVALVTVPLSAMGKEAAQPMRSGPASAALGMPSALMVADPVTGAQPLASVMLTE